MSINNGGGANIGPNTGPFDNTAAYGKGRVATSGSAPGIAYLCYEPLSAPVQPSGADGSVGNGNSNSAPPLTTAKTNDEIFILVAGETNSGSVTGVTSSPAGLTFTKRTGIGPTGGGIMELWSAPSAAALTNEVITVAQTGIALIRLIAFAIIGSPSFDPNASLPWSARGGSPTITTTDDPDILIWCDFHGGGALNIPPGYTVLENVPFGGDNCAVAIKLVNAPVTESQTVAGDEFIIWDAVNLTITPVVNPDPSLDPDHWVGAGQT
jgi:hypothetical protein